MNSKGFTLIELLFTIVILALVVGIAVPSYLGISEAINKNQRKNIIKKIEIAASKYAYDTSETIIFVEELITEGYLDSDDEEGNITDPVNNKRMNCYIVEMKKVSDYYSAKFIDGNNYDDNGVCDISKLDESSKDVYIQVTKDGSIINDDNWIKGNNIVLKAHSNNTVIIDCTNNKCSWTSSSGANKVGVDNISLNYINDVLETKYTFQYTVFKNDMNDIIRYTDFVNLKIDNKAPVIYNDQIEVRDRYKDTSSKEITIIASDGNGSGINGYFLGKNISNCNVSGINYQDDNKITVYENGNYLICVKDAVGNISAANISINHII